MKISLNGEPHSAPDNSTLADLLCELQIPSQEVAVEVNLELIPRADHGLHSLLEADQDEVVRLVGGG